MSNGELSQQEVVDYIKGISVLELSQLVKALEKELGVSAAAAMPMAVAGGGGGSGGAAAPAEEKTEFTATPDRSRRATRSTSSRSSARSPASA